MWELGPNSDRGSVRLASVQGPVSTQTQAFTSCSHELRAPCYHEFLGETCTPRSPRGCTDQAGDLLGRMLDQLGCVSDRGCKIKRPVCDTEQGRETLLAQSSSIVRK